MIASRLGTTWETAAVAVLAAAGIFVAVIVYTRIVGLRSFSKMSSFDFAMTVAVGSAMGTVSLASASLLTGTIGLATLFAVQALIAWLRRTAGFSRVVDNQPLVLMAGSRILEDNLSRARVTEDDIRAKLREANVLNLKSVRAVILESTGDISVLHGDNDIDLEVLRNVIDADELKPEAEGGGVRWDESG